MVEQGGTHGAHEFRVNNNPPEAEIITAEMLENDNHSPEASENRRLWQINKAEGKMHVVKACLDARTMLTEPEKSYGLLSIAAAGNVEPYREILTYEGVRDIIIITHYDGETVVRGQMPTECGGLGEKAKSMESDLPLAVEGVAGYVHNRIKHPDPIIQSVLEAREITKMTNKPTLAATQDHRTGKLDIIGCYWRNNGMFLSAVNTAIEPQDLEPENYDPRKLYENGMPAINPDALPDVFEMFRDYAYENQRMVDKMRRKYPDISEILRVQNPDILLLTTVLQPAKLRYPKTLERPGSYAKLAVPRFKDRYNGIREIHEKDLRETLDQAEYPITHSLENHDDKTKPFSKTGTFLIETSDIDISENLAKYALKRKWMRKWVDIPEHHIIASEIKGGIATKFLEVA